MGRTTNALTESFLNNVNVKQCLVAEHFEATSGFWLVIQINQRKGRVMQWQGNITILGVWASRESQNASIFFRNAIGVVGWRRIAPLAADGVTNIVTLAVAAQMSGRICQLLITNAGDILAISTI